MKKQTKKNAADATLRNVRAAVAREKRTLELIISLEARYVKLVNRVDAIERRQEAWSRQETRAERDNIEGGQTPPTGLRPA